MKWSFSEIVITAEFLMKGASFQCVTQVVVTTIVTGTVRILE